MDQNKGGKIVLLIFLLICSGLGITAFIMSFTNKCGEGFSPHNCQGGQYYNTTEKKCQNCPEGDYYYGNYYLKFDGCSGKKSEDCCEQSKTFCYSCWGEGKYSRKSGTCDSCPENTYQTKPCADGYNGCSWDPANTKCKEDKDVCSSCIDKDNEIPNYWNGKRANLVDGRYCKCKDGYVRNANGWCKPK